MEPAGAIVVAVGSVVVGPAILFVMKTDVNGASQLRKVPVQIAKKEFDVAPQKPIVFLGEVALRTVGFHVFGAEHPDGALKLGTAQGKIEGDDEEQARFSQNQLDYENGERGKGKRDHDSQRGSVSGIAEYLLAEMVDELVVGAGEELVSLAQGTNLPQQGGHRIESDGKQTYQRYRSNACEREAKRETTNYKFTDDARGNCVPGRACASAFWHVVYIRNSYFAYEEHIPRLAR